MLYLFKHKHKPNNHSLAPQIHTGQPGVYSHISPVDTVNACSVAPVLTNVPKSHRFILANSVSKAVSSPTSTVNRCSVKPVPSGSTACNTQQHQHQPPPPSCPAQKMAQKIFSPSRLKFKTIFTVLVSLTFTVLIILYMSNISLENSRTWLRNVTRQIQFYYLEIGVNNKTLLTPTSHDQWTPNATEVDLTLRTMQNVSHVTQAEDLHYHVAHPHNYHYIMDEPEKCEQLEPFLTLMVPVAPHQLEARNAIRGTWGNESVVQGKVVLVLFMLALPVGAQSEKLQEQVQLESQQHHDLVQSNFMDSYQNLTIKTLVIMDWLATHCSQASYAMKVDSDMFLNLENLISMLLTPNIPKENYMTGMVMWNRPVIRDKNSKWYVQPELYPEEYYPTYVLGMGYVFSNDLPKKIVGICKDVKPFNIEDAYIGACLKHLGLSPSTSPDPSKFKAYFNGNYQRSDFASLITMILGTPQQLVTFWKDVKNPT